MSVTRKFFAIMALIVIGNDLQWLGFPWKFDAWWLAHTVSPVSGAVWGSGLLLLLAPWVHRGSRFVGGLIAVGAIVLAYVTAMLMADSYNAPIFELVNEVTAFPLVTWSLAGGIALLMTALWPLNPVAVITVRELEPEEIGREVRPVAPDPAVTAALYGVDCAE